MNGNGEEQIVEEGGKEERVPMGEEPVRFNVERHAIRHGSGRRTGRARAPGILQAKKKLNAT